MLPRPPKKTGQTDAAVIKGEEMTVPIAWLDNWGDNPRNFKKSEIARLKNQIQNLGIYKRLLAVPDPEAYGYGYPGEVEGRLIVIGGNGRLLILRELQHQEVGITLVRPRDRAQLVEYALSDNDHVGQTDEQAMAEILYKERDQIKLSDYRIDIGRTMHPETLLTAFGPDINLDDEDKVPEPEPTSEVEIGDLFDLGPHRLICGDATQPEPYEAVLQGEKADLVWTDPPWNVDYHGDKYDGLLNDAMSADQFIEFSEAFFQRMAENTKEGGIFYVCCGYSSYPPFLYALKKAGMTFSTLIVWVKDETTHGFADYKKQHEMILKARKKKQNATPILYGWNGGRHYFIEDRYEADVWEIKNRARHQMLHPTQKPLGLIAKAIRNSSQTGETILDPFGGSGSTLIAAERDDRKARLIELDPKFIDVTIRRYAALTNIPEDRLRETRRNING